MHKQINIIVLLVVTLMGLSCEKTVDNIDLPEAEEKMVVYSFISPGCDTVFAEVTRSEPYFGNDIWGNSNEIVSDAELLFIHDGTEKKLQYDPLEENYFITLNGLQITSGDTYQIKATAPGLDDTFSKCTIPSPAPQDITYEGADYYYEYGERIRMYFSFSDIPDEENYYRLLVSESDTTYDGYVIWRKMTLSYDYFAYLLTDKNTSNGKITAEISQYMGYEESDHTLKITLLAIDKNYYEYYEKLNLVYINDDNPFSEPVIPYSNIENGLGLFAGYTKHSKIITVKY
ncbi:MAG: DUF4249 domain-containing protein [Bacteroidales bacterium]|nr:DUF4249 domain-containing protein [Bacteroidales bacterium]